MDYVKRKQIRIKGFDYSSDNYYYVTICSHNKKHIFGMGNDLTVYGRIAENNLLNIHNYYDDVNVIKHVVMPNHIHAVISIGCDEAARKNPCPTLGNIVGAYKAEVTREIRKITPGYTVWQARFYEHIIRNEFDFEDIWTYIDENPIKWENDDYY